MQVGRAYFVAFVACSVFLTDAKVVQVTDDNWSIIQEGEWMVKFYAPWCPACKAIAPVWTEFSTQDKVLGIQVGEVDVSASPGLSGRFLVTSLPTFYHVRNGEFRVYTGSRGKDDFTGYIAHGRYEELTPVPAWKAPNSIIMTVVSLIFQLSMKVRHFHLLMTTEYGFPAWSVYGFFAVCTVSMGLILGMILVFITDCICPTKRPTRPLESGTAPEDEQEEEPISKTKDKDEDEEEETQDQPTPAADETTDQSGDTSLRKRKTETETTDDKN
ncbi:thioredoxin-related transmembrane protein 1-like isoform X2 [Patiria miniata]|uniref:Thioredoxin domain-containing protein n=1 Tax=Patiria miniata TaxID=46514 RepID=A0A914BIW6_PATMI|nr:thioredoxin-related transmembrane protein 1-like isoform X2 [Patiria miniata]